MQDHDNPQQQAGKRRYIGVNFECCQVYARVYFNAKLNAYHGHCPKCLRVVKVEVDPSRATTSARFFKAE